MLRLFQMTTALVVVPEDVVEQGKEILDAAKADPVLLAVLIGVGVLTAGIFFWGITKQLFKAAIVAGLLSLASGTGTSISTDPPFRVDR